MASVSDPDLQTKIDADSDPDFQAKLDAVMDHFLKFDRDRSIPLIGAEIDCTPPEPEELERLNKKLMNSCPTFFSTRDARRYEAEDFMKWVAKPKADYSVVKASVGSYDVGSDDVVDHLWHEQWLGITWVALQRKHESLCVVVRNTDLLNLERELVKCKKGLPIKRFLDRFWNTIISHIEDTKEHVLVKSCPQSFALVSVAAACKDLEAEREAANLAKKTMEFFRKFFYQKLISGTSLTSEETVQTAIMATQHLFEQEFEADELRVFVWEKEDLIAEELLQKREDLDLDLGLDLEELLACMDADNDGSKRRRLDAGALCS